jgi:sRNA-binding carbon storage regulator CsrA
MKTIEIPRGEWTRALDVFSRLHEGWLVSLEVLAPSIGAQTEFRNLPLVGVTSEPGGGGTITITVAESSGNPVTHSIHAPEKVSIEQTDADADVAVEIKSADGETAILQFKTATRPETADGATPSRG